LLNNSTPGCEASLAVEQQLLFNSTQTDASKLISSV
jgi:hypothetical protein